VIGDAELLSAVLAVLETDPNFDLVLYATATWGEHDAQRLLPALIDAAARSDKVAAVCSWSARNLTEPAEALLRAADVPTFTAADDAIAALGLAARAGRLDGPAYRRERLNRHVPRPATMSGVPTEHDVKQFLGRHGLPVSREVVAHDVSEAQLGAATLGWPIVAKQLCKGLVHKSDLGLVRVGLDTPEDLDAALRDFAAIVAAEGLSTQGVLLAELLRGFEVIVGGTRDASFGPVVMIGAGGVLAEHLDDAVFALCPVSPDEAASMIARLRIGRILSGYRGVAYDVTALATLVSDFSRLFAAAPWIDSIDLNPVVVRTGTGGATIVDAALVLDQPDVRSRQ